ncbi:CapA family protein [Lacticigenium naphthae]|uniref:CapA family protein n=1 Tax=Lacticigenium naphthae TaxID=515351 RepID=UPI000401F75F|nr:CapA family protein [Lacticigenium naphthae]
MRSTNRKKKSQFNKILVVIIGILALLIGAGFFFANSNSWFGESDSSPETEEISNEEALSSNTKEEEETEIVEEETFIDIQISAVGDVMAHGNQLISAYDSGKDSYDFSAVFEDVKPFISESDLAIANLETTLAGPTRAYIGYPLFNTPDAIVDGLAYAGFDMLATANNHSLDTRADGLKRTAKVITEKGLDPVGTYEDDPESRIQIKDVEGIKVAILGYTEHVNGMEAQYTSEELSSMINLLSEEQILADIEEANSHDPDIIMTYIHWGNEYAKEPNELQTSYAELLTREGVDIILGSHPHVIQPTEFLEVDGNKSFVAYSLGNFVSNQRRESLGAGFEATEDGVIINMDIQKSEKTGETKLKSIDLVPTWVYRNREEGQSAYTYRILPIEAHLDDSSLSEDYLNRMKTSYEETMNRMNLDSSQFEE